MQQIQNFIYTFLPAARKPASAYTILLLHGTGGNENDLIPVGKMFGNSVNLLGVRGQVQENGMSRFFRRVAEGIFDLPDLHFRTTELAEYLDEASAQLEFDRNKIVALGYSNGANIAGSLLISYPQRLAGAILFRPMIPFEPPADWHLDRTPVLLAAGSLDRTLPPDEPKRWNQLLTQAGAIVTLHTEDTGHNLTQADISFSQEWFRQYFKAP
jgi:phospholipase/carboxylesterase